MTPNMLLALVGVFISVALATGSVAWLALYRTTTEQRRLRDVTRVGAPRATVLPELLPLSGGGPKKGAWHQAGTWLRSPKDMGRLRQRLVRAGFPHPAAPVIYTTIELLGPFVVGGTIAMTMQPPQSWLIAVVAAAALFFGPGFWVELKLGKRRRDIENGLPDALDLLIVCIEAGSGLDQAILKTAEELSIAYPALGEELRILNTEVRAGKTRLEAFKNLATRTKVEDVRSLVAMLIQTDRFGTSIGQALRTHAETARSKRRQRAEEAAQKIAVKLVFPLVLCFFPAFYVVILGPAIIQFSHSFMQ